MSSSAFDKAIMAPISVHECKSMSAADRVGTVRISVIEPAPLRDISRVRAVEIPVFIPAGKDMDAFLSEISGSLRSLLSDLDLLPELGAQLEFTEEADPLIAVGKQLVEAMEDDLAAEVSGSRDDPSGVRRVRLTVFPAAAFAASDCDGIFDECVDRLVGLPPCCETRINGRIGDRVEVLISHNSFAPVAPGDPIPIDPGVTLRPRDDSPDSAPLPPIEPGLYDGQFSIGPDGQPVRLDEPVKPESDPESGTWHDRPSFLGSA